MAVGSRPLLGPGWRELVSRTLLACAIVLGAVGAICFALQAREGRVDLNELMVQSLVGGQLVFTVPLLYSRLWQRWAAAVQHTRGAPVVWYCRGEDGRTGVLSCDGQGHLHFVEVRLSLSKRTPGLIVLGLLVCGLPGLLLAVRWEGTYRGTPEPLLGGQRPLDASQCPPRNVARWLLLGERPLLFFAGDQQVELLVVGAARLREVVLERAAQAA